MTSRLGQFCISVTDLERSEQFYTRVCELKVQQRLEIPDAKEIIVGTDNSQCQIQLAQKTAQNGPVDHGDDALWKFYIYTDDIEGMCQRTRDFGCEVSVEPMVLEEWNVTVAFITDPDGYNIEIVQGA